MRMNHVKFSAYIPLIILSCLGVHHVQAVSFAGGSIASSGVYELTNDIVYTGTATNTAITINANNVTLDLKDHVIRGGTMGIHVLSGVQNITIKNGTIRDMEMHGVFLYDASFVELENVVVLECQQGFLLNKATEIRAADCVAAFNQEAGFSLVQSTTNVFETCKAVGNGQTGWSDAYGFVASGGGYNTFDRCLAQHTQTNGILESDLAAGFMLKNGERGSKILNCTSECTRANRPGSAKVYGIAYLNSDGEESVASVPLYSVSFNAFGDRLATGGQTRTDGKEVVVYSFNGSTLIPKAYAAHGAQVNSVAFNLPGDRLAIGGQAGAQGKEVSIYAYNGNTLILVDSASHGATVNSVSFDVKGSRLVIGGETAPDGKEIRIYAFNGSQLTLKDSASHGARVKSVSVDYDGTRIAVGGEQGTLGNEVSLYTFDGTSLSLSGTASHGATVNAAGITRYPFDANRSGVIIGGQTAPDGKEIRGIMFDGQSFIPMVHQSHGAAVHAVTMGRFIVIAGETSSGDNKNIRAYDIGNEFMFERLNANHGAKVRSISFNEDMRSMRLAIAGDTSLTDGKELRIYTHLPGSPTLIELASMYNGEAASGESGDCIILNNIVHGTTGGSEAIGI